MALLNSIVSAWHLDSNANDAADGNNLAVSGATFNNSIFKLGTGAIQFDGINDFCRMDLPSNLKTANFTYSAWIYLDVGWSSIGVILSGNPRQARVGGKGSIFQILPDQKAQIRIGDNSGSLSTTGGLTAMSTGAWHHIVGSYDGTDLNLYLDGILDSQTSPAITIHWPDGAFGFPVPGQLYFGADKTNSLNCGSTCADRNFFFGLIDEINIWDRALTDGGVAVGNTAGGEIAQLYNNGNGFEYPFVTGTRSRQARLLDIKQGFKKTGSQAARIISTKGGFK